MKGGKSKKKGAPAPERHSLSLPEELDADRVSEMGSAGRQRARGAKKRKFQESDEVLKAELTDKILSQARQQQQEIARELERESGAEATRQALDMAAAVLEGSRGALVSAKQGQGGKPLCVSPSASPLPEGRDQKRKGRKLAAPAVSSSESEGESDSVEETGGGEGAGDEGAQEEERGHGVAARGGSGGEAKAQAGSIGRESGSARAARDQLRGLEGLSLGATSGRDDASKAAEDSDTASQYDDAARDITEEDERAIAVFLMPPSEAPRQRTLADVIREKVASAQQGEGEQPEDGMGAPLPREMQTKVEAVYRGVGELLSRYTTGKVPKAFKLIPALANWEDVLHLTAPETWTAHAMFAATRLFASNLNARMAQRFFRLVLLPRVRRDIRENRRLHFGLYQALKKALYKPSAFFKGILLPICQSRTCSLREAVILGSVIQKVSIPVLHSSVALMRIAEMPYAGTNSYFMKLFFDKKYALPYRVLDAVVNHFLQFREDSRDLPVIWHQSLLSFVQRYKDELTNEQKGDLRSLMKAQSHYLMTPEIDRELSHSTRSRGEKAAVPGAASGNMPFSGAQGRTKRPKLHEDFRSLPPVDVCMYED